MGFLPSGGGGSSGALTLLSSTTISGSAAVFDVASIAGTFNDLLLVASIRANVAGVLDIPVLTFNNDTAANYATNRLKAVTTTASVLESNSVAGLYLGDAPAASGTASAFSHLQVYVTGYASTSWLKQIKSSLVYPTAITTGGRELWEVVGLWNSTAAINRVNLSALTTPFTWVVGSQLRIYGVL